MASSIFKDIFSRPFGREFKLVSTHLFGDKNMMFIVTPTRMSGDVGELQ